MKERLAVLLSADYNDPSIGFGVGFEETQQFRRTSNILNFPQVITFHLCPLFYLTLTFHIKNKWLTVQVPDSFVEQVFEDLKAICSNTPEKGVRIRHQMLRDTSVELLSIDNLINIKKRIENRCENRQNWIDMRVDSKKEMLKELFNFW